MNEMNRDNWWQKVEPKMRESLCQIWIPVGLPGHAGEEKSNWQHFLNNRYGAHCWRISHYVRGQILPKAEAIREYEQGYRVYLTQHPEVVDFLVKFCGNVYDDNPTNVHDTSYNQPDTHLNHYQDISIRRVISELVDDPKWPNVTNTPTEVIDLTDLNTGQLYHFPRARGFRGNYLLQVREPDTPGFFLNPAVVPIHDPALVTSLPSMSDWYLKEGCAHLSIEAFWQMSKVIEVRYDSFLEQKEARLHPLEGL